MVQRAKSVNPAVLTWARERAGLSILEVAERLGKSTDAIASWEEGRAYPAYGQLETLAESIYRRPVALFFLPEPPDEIPAQREFRRLPQTDASALSADTLYALRDAHAFQASLRELTGGKNLASRQIFRDLRPQRESDLPALAEIAREYVGVSLSAQLTWSNEEKAVAEWRGALEDVGVFVFKRSFQDRTVSGFCLDDPDFPLIIVNNSTSFTRQVFTLFHELAHLLVGVSTISSNDYSQLARFTSTDRALEVACNRFAADFLVPDSGFPWQDFQAAKSERFLAAMAERYSVSREVILRKARDRGLVTPDEYLYFTNTWANEPARDGGGETGGNYYATQSVYFSKRFLELTFAQFRAGRITLSEVAEHLRMRAKNVEKFEGYLMRRG